MAPFTSLLREPTRPAAPRGFRWPLSGLGLGGLLACAALLPGVALAADPLVRFEGGIGSQPLRSAGNGLAAQVNDVNGVPPGGRPWVISRLTAEVTTDGRIRVDGRGLLLAGGGTIGTPGGQSVRARLFCDNVAVGESPLLVPLETNGDFRIDAVLNGPVPALCKTPVLLIVNGGGAWFAAGIPKD